MKGHPHHQKPQITPGNPRHQPTLTTQTVERSPSESSFTSLRKTNLATKKKVSNPSKKKKRKLRLGPSMYDMETEP